MARLELEDVVAGYGDTTVLRGVSLAVPDGTVVALLGPNGAGKSTLLGVASGLVRPTGGRVLLDGVDRVGDGPARLVADGLCHVTESGAVYGGLTVEDNLRMFADRADPEASIQRAIDAFPRLGERLQQVAGTLSGGEQRMLALARSYARRPEVILLDEISLGLAPIVVDEIFGHLRALASTGAGLLIVEQYVRRVLQLADIVYVLARGRIAFVGEPDELRGSAILEQYLGAEVR